MKNLIFILLMTASCTPTVRQTEIPAAVADKAIAALCAKDASQKATIEKGVRQTARLWRESDGGEDDFIRFCEKNYIVGGDEKRRAFLKISDYLEGIWGNYNEMVLRLQRNLHENTGALDHIDEVFAAYTPSAHFDDDFFANKMAFVVALNFPELSLAEKDALGDDRLEWAYARLGDLFTARVPAEINKAVAAANSDAEVYISNYVIHAGHLVGKDGAKLFHADMTLTAHWNMRDEIKASYANGQLARQQTIYEAMRRIISQEIPTQAINSGEYDWNPFANTLSRDGNPVDGTPERNVRYEKLLNNFKALSSVDRYAGKNAIERAFSEEMEVSVDDAEALFESYLSTPELKNVGSLVSSRLNRPLEAFDIWYDGFKTRSSLNEDDLSRQTRLLYPDAASFERQIPAILSKLGFSADRAAEIASRIEVDAARGSGHAWGAAMKGQKAHLRTRIPDNGMDYKGYNIAIHELGHNVEQTISLYDMDYYMLNGVPNTAFTEALAFVFQRRDLELLGVKADGLESASLEKYDKAWTLYEICGVALVDIRVWKWLYAHPDASADELKAAVIGIAREVWNRYYEPVFGVKDEPVLAVYSHSISYPLYLSAYAYGQIIEAQLEQYFKGKNLAAEVDRIYRLGRLTPNRWIIEATGKPLSVEELIIKN